MKLEKETEFSLLIGNCTHLFSEQEAFELFQQLSKHFSYGFNNCTPFINFEGRRTINEKGEIIG